MLIKYLVKKTSLLVLFKKRTCKGLNDVATVRTQLYCPLVRSQLEYCPIVWHENFAGVYHCGWVTFCVLRELSFAIMTHWFFLLGINICDFQKVPSTQH